MFRIISLAQPASAAEPIDAELLNSDRPKTVTLDPRTGAVLSVTAGVAQQEISHRHTCQNGDACFRSGRVPYADQGFYGSAGMKAGNWPYRSGYFTGRYIARFCWNNDVCAPFLDPNTEAFFPGGGLVTGKSVTFR